MDRLLLFLTLLLMACSSFAACQSSTVFYTFVATANGTMERNLQCRQNDYVFSSHIFVNVLFYHVTYDEISKGLFSKNKGFEAREYQVDDSREDKPANYKIVNGVTDWLNMEQTIRFCLQQKIAIQSMRVLADGEEKQYQFTVISPDDKLQTPLGLLKTTIIEGVELGGDKVRFWFWKDNNYMMVRQKIWDNRDEIFDATIKYF